MNVGHCHLLSVLFEEPELEALIQLELPDVPHLVQMLPGGVQLIQETGHLAQTMSNITSSSGASGGNDPPSVYPHYLGNQTLEVSRARDAVPPGKPVTGSDALQQPLAFSVQILHWSLQHLQTTRGRVKRAVNRLHRHASSSHLLLQLRVLLYEPTGPFHISREVLLGQELLKHTGW